MATPKNIKSKPLAEWKKKVSDARTDQSRVCCPRAARDESASTAPMCADVAQTNDTAETDLFFFFFFFFLLVPCCAAVRQRVRLLMVSPCGENVVGGVAV